jgi:hypothetical protein
MVTHWKRGHENTATDKEVWFCDELNRYGMKKDDACLAARHSRELVRRVQVSETPKDAQKAPQSI